jgi:hypothetical protein
MQPREWQVRFGLHTGGRERGRAAVACRLRGLSQQARLADARLAAKHERLAVGGYPVQE